MGGKKSLACDFELATAPKAKSLPQIRTPPAKDFVGEVRNHRLAPTLVDGLILKSHRASNALDLTSGDLPGPLPHHLLKRLPRNEQNDQIASKCIGGPPQLVH